MAARLFNQTGTKSLTVKVPASSANLGPGFDTLGMALELYLEIEITLSPGRPGLEITGEGSGYLNDNPEQNLVLLAMHRVFNRNNLPFPDINIRMNNEIPLARGLGSSAAAVTAGLCAANALLDSGVDRKTLLHWALEIEGHADNIVPALFGGMNCVMLYEGQVFHQAVPVPAGLSLVLAVPDFTLSTEKARQVLPEYVDLRNTVSNLQRACYLLASFFNRDLRHLDKAMNDMIYQPVRKHLIPGFDSVLEQAREAGAAGVAMSGAGPSIIALCWEGEHEVGLAMQEGFARVGITSAIYQLQADRIGAEVLTRQSSGLS